MYHRFQSEPWSITPEGILALSNVWTYNAPAAAKPGKNFFGDDLPKMEVRDGIAIIPVSGPLIRAGGFLERGLGATVHGDVEDMLATANADPAVRAILLNVDSPGGTLAGTPELAAAVAASKKPTHCFTSGVLASAAFYIAAGAKTISATPSASVGSIGVILATSSILRALEAGGIDVTVITSGALKGTGHPATKLSGDQRDHLQERVDQSAQMFKAHVQKHRPGVKPDSMTGASYFAAEAKQRGLVDHVVGGIHEVIAIVRAASPAPKPATPPGPTPGSAQDFVADVRQLTAAGMTRGEAIAEAVKSNPRGHRSWLANRVPL